jgi:hypothetical protein
MATMRPPNTSKNTAPNPTEQSRQSATGPGGDTFQLPRGLSASTADVSIRPTINKAMPAQVSMIQGQAPATNVDASWRAKSSAGVYGPRPTVTGTYNSPPPYADTHSYGATVGGGISMNSTPTTAPTSIPSYGGTLGSSSITSNTTAPIPIPTTSNATGFASTYKPSPVAFNATGVPSTYKPVPVPQVSPFHAAAIYGAASTGLNLGNLNHGSSSTSSALQQQLQQASNGHHYGQQSSSSALVASSSKTSIAATGVAAATTMAMTNYNHQDQQHQEQQSALRRRLTEIWLTLKESEREQIGQFEAWAEVEGMCAHCFKPGSTPAEAPRSHHKDEKWSEKRQEWRKKKSSRRGSFFGRIKQQSSTSSSSSPSSSSDSSSDDGKNKRKDAARKIRHQQKMARRREKEEYRRKTGMFSSAATAFSKVFGVAGSRRSSSSNSSSSTSEKDIVRYTGGVDYNSGRKSHDGVYESVKQSKSTTSFIGTMFSTGKQKARTSFDSPPLSPTSPTSSCNTGLAYGSSVGSKRTASGGGGFFFRRPKKAASTDSSSDPLAYGELYSSSPDKKSLDSSSQKSQKSYAGSIASSIGVMFGGVTRSRRTSLAEYSDRRAVHTSSHTRHNGSTAPLSRHNSTGGSRAYSSKHGQTLTSEIESGTGTSNVHQVRRQPSNSSGWLGSQSAGSVKSRSSSGSSWFGGDGAAAYSKEIEEKKREKRSKERSVSTGVASWFGFGRSKTTVEKAPTQSRSKGKGILGMGGRSRSSSSSKSDDFESVSSRNKRGVRKIKSPMTGSLRSNKGKGRVPIMNSKGETTYDYLDQGTSKV